MFGFLKQFFADLAGPARPCDICQLGQPDALKHPRANFDWKFSDHGLAAEFFICAKCRSLIRAAGLEHQLPPVAVAYLIAKGKIDAPPLQAYLDHPVWRRVWVHTLAMTGAQPLSDADMLRVLQESQATMIARFLIEN